jgi:hypothetical protein
MSVRSRDREEIRTSQVAGAHRPESDRRRPSTAGYWLAVVIPVVGLLAGAGWGITAYLGMQRQIDDFVRVGVPGQTVVSVQEAAERILYYEESESISLTDLAPQVSAPDGTAVRVEAYDLDLRYDAPGGGVGQAIGTFDADSPGPYEVRINGTAPPGAEIAIGETIANSRLGSVVGAVLLILGSLGVGIVLTIVTAVRRSAH